MFCRTTVICLLNCITETVQVTEGRVRPAGPMLGSPVVVGMLARRRAGLPGVVFDSRKEEEVFIFSEAFCPALGTTLRSFQSVLAALLLRVKRLGRIADRSSPLTADVKEWSYTLMSHMSSVWCMGTALPLHVTRCCYCSRLKEMQMYGMVQNSGGLFVNCTIKDG
jgi:hypothetical protein